MPSRSQIRREELPAPKAVLSCGTDECVGPGGNVVAMRVTTLKAGVDRLDELLAYNAGLAEDRERPVHPARGPVDHYLGSPSSWSQSGWHAGRPGTP